MANKYEDGFDSEFLKIKVQNGPIKEVGINGVQVDELIVHAKACIEDFNQRFPCRENALAITKLDEALMWLAERTKDRTIREVEGTNMA